MNTKRQSYFNYIKNNPVLKEQIFMAEGKTYTCCKTEVLETYIIECEENLKAVKERVSIWSKIKNLFKR